MKSNETTVSNPSPTSLSKNPVRQLLDQNPEAIDGFLSYEYGLCAPSPLAELRGSFRLWETWAKTLPFLYKSGNYREFFDTQPVLDIKDLPDEDLLRANQILGLCAHAVVHFSEEDEGSAPTTGGWKTEIPPRCPFKPTGASTSESVQGSTTQGSPGCPFKPSAPSATQDEKPKTNPKSESRIPAMIREPWKAVNARLGRPVPTFTYYDYFTLNVVHRNEPRIAPFELSRSSRKQYSRLRCDVAVFGDNAENVFVIMNHDMEFQSIPLVRLACEATDCVVTHDTEGLAKALFEIGNVVSKITEVFLHANPNSQSDLFCDPVSWSKSIGILIPPILDSEMSMSGLQSSFTHLVDALIGRHEFTGDLGELANEERPWLPSLHQELFRSLSKVSIRSYVLSSTNGNLHGSFNRLVQLFVDGFLEAHRIKMMGFLELGIKTGRSQSSGQTAQATTGWQGRVWQKVNEDCLHSMAEREQLQTRPRAQGFTSAFVESITRQTPGGDSYKIVFNTVGSGVQYEAGDRIQVLPRNPSGVIERMLASMQIEGGFVVPFELPEWRSAVEQHYPEMANQPVLPVASLLRIMVLRPLTKAIVRSVCKAMQIADTSGVVAAFRAGRLDDVPDLIEFIKQSCGCQMSQATVLDICSFLSPLMSRLYSIANAPCRDEAYQSKVSIVISRVWYQTVSVAEGKAEDRLGVCTSSLLNDSLYNYVPIRFVEEKAFHLPEPPFSGSIMLIALGSGASPMFAFIEELLNRKTSGRSSKNPEVFFCWGLARPPDLFNVPLLERAVQEIGLKLCVSFSRDHKRVRVDDGKIEVVEGRRERITTALLKDDWPKTISRLAKGSGMFYLCGHPSLGNTVRAVIEQALATSGLLSLSESQQQYARVIAGQRIRSDMFFSGSIHDPRLPTFSAAEVSRHNRFDDIWFVYRDYVYDVTEYMNLHPGGNKILFDKAGRDATEDFKAAHGPDNLRVESAMIPYRIGRLPIRKFSTQSHQEAYGVVLQFLHTVCEVRNVFYLDVNIFEGANEAAGSSHSLAMRSKTHNKFVTSSVPMLYNAMSSFHQRTEALYQKTSIGCPRLHPSDLKIMHTFRDSLQAVLLSVPDPKAFLATELCQVEKDFLFEFLDAVANLVETANSAEESGPALTISGLQDMCNRAQQRLERLFDSIDASPLNEGDSSCILQSLGSMSGFELLGEADLNDSKNVMCLKLQKGDCVFRAGDILDMIYVVLEGSVTAEDVGVETDHFSAGATFGGTKQSHKIAPQKQMLGNQTMSYNAIVASKVCRIAILHPMQVLMSKTTGSESVGIDDVLFDESSWRSSLSAKGSIHQALFRKAVFRVTLARSMHSTMKSLTIRKSRLTEYFPPDACEALAEESTEVSVKARSVLAKAGDEATKCWVLIEGQIGIEVNNEIVWEYSKAGHVFGERGFALAVHKTDDVMYQETLVALEDSRVLEIPREAVDTIFNGPLKKECHALMALDSLITKHPVLNSLPRLTRYGVLRIFRQVKIPAKEVVFEHGEAGDSAFVVISGKLELRAEQDAVVSELNPGDGTGFDMLLQPGERNSMCVAAKTTICWTVNNQALLDGLRVSSRPNYQVLETTQSKTQTKRTVEKKKKEDSSQ